MQNKLFLLLFNDHKFMCGINDFIFYELGTVEITHDVTILSGF